MGMVLTISLGNKAMQFAEVSYGRSGVVVKRLVEKEIPEGLMDDGVILDKEAMARLLTAALRESNIKIKKVIFTIPSGKVMSREIVLPAMKEKRILETVKSNAEEYFPIGLEDYVLSYFKIANVFEEEGPEEEQDGKEDEDKSKKKKSRGKAKRRKKRQVSQRLMILAASNDMIQSYYDVAALARLNLISLDYVGNSVLQVITNQIGEETCLVIQMREDSTTLTVFNNMVMMLQRNMNYGTADVIHILEDMMGLSYQTAQKKLEEKEIFNREENYELKNGISYFLSNVERVIEYYRGRNPDMPVTNIYLVGEGARIADMPEMLEENLGLPVHILSTLKRVLIRPTASVDTMTAMEHMEAIGAVIAPVGFLPRALEQDLRRKLETKACRILMLLAVFAGLIIITIPALDFFSLSSEKIDLEAKLMALGEVEQIYENYLKAEAKYNDVEAVEAIVRTNNESLEGFINIFEQLRPSNITITSFACNDGKITFSALADGKNTVIKLITQLKTIANVYDVDVSGLSSTFEEDGSETVAFSITCILMNEDSVFMQQEAGEAYPGNSGQGEAGAALPDGEDSQDDALEEDVDLIRGSRELPESEVKQG